MLIAESVSFRGRHTELVAPTSLRADRGEVVLLVAEPQLTRTALALLCSGRMKPTSGCLSWTADQRLAAVRSHSAIVDSPGINAPESHLKVQDLVAEDLALVPKPFWRKHSAKKWLVKHGFEDLGQDWTDAADPLRLLELQLKLATDNPRTGLLVIDSPDRHGIPDENWLQLLEEHALSRRNLAVVATVSRVPEEWEGTVVFVGSTQTSDSYNLPLPDNAAPAADPLMELTTEMDPEKAPALPVEAEATADTDPSTAEFSELAAEQSVPEALEANVPASAEPDVSASADPDAPASMEQSTGDNAADTVPRPSAGDLGEQAASETPAIEKD